MINQRLFLVGCPRSGTTLLQSLLAAHPAIISFPESHFFRHLYPEHEPRRKRYHLASCCIKSYLINFGNSIGAKDINKCIKPWTIFQSQYIHLFVSVLDRIAQENGKEIWLEKTPDHLQYMPLIERHIKKAKFIHLIRNGPDTIASLYEVTHQHPQHWGNRTWSLDNCIDKWVQAISTSLNYENQGNHVLVSYEKLVEDPEKVLSKIFRDLNLDFSAKILSRSGNRSRSGNNIIKDYESWKQDVYQPIKDTYRFKFDSLFSTDQKTQVMQKISKLEEQLEHVFGQEKRPSIIPNP
ncbi:sulfotransferase family protein [Leptolyngbya sp. PCC 6406]|uniref:sulfotransferase family protein n=1 Tax=Leptolyngbya sp. PCC 6406 TaxID=1173264 RepID=UPI0002ABA82C|nr:sulfotransferase [Leptolyngbya sp. PCC 6406]